MAGNEHISCTYGLGLLDRLLDISHNMSKIYLKLFSKKKKFYFI
jgi:hypothetical protein